MGSLVYGRLLIYGKWYAFPLETTRSEAEKVERSATHGASLPIAIDGASLRLIDIDGVGADGSAQRPLAFLLPDFMHVK